MKNREYSVNVVFMDLNKGGGLRLPPKGCG
jgi:hypothetical protein